MCGSCPVMTTWMTGKGVERDARMSPDGIGREAAAGMEDGGEGVTGTVVDGGAGRKEVREGEGEEGVGGQGLQHLLPTASVFAN